jgi:hypothetical protein
MLQPCCMHPRANSVTCCAVGRTQQHCLIPSNPPPPHLTSQAQQHKGKLSSLAQHEPGPQALSPVDRHTTRHTQRVLGPDYKGLGACYAIALVSAQHMDGDQTHTVDTNRSHAPPPHPCTPAPQEPQGFVSPHPSTPHSLAEPEQRPQHGVDCCLEAD